MLFKHLKSTFPENKQKPFQKKHIQSFGAKFPSIRKDQLADVAYELLQSSAQKGSMRDHRKVPVFSGGSGTGKTRSLYDLMEILGEIITKPDKYGKQPIQFFEGFTPVPLYLSYGNGTAFEDQEKNLIADASLSLRAFIANYVEERTLKPLVCEIASISGIEKVSFGKFLEIMMKEMGLNKAIFFIGIDEIQVLYGDQLPLTSYSFLLFPLFPLFFSFFAFSFANLFFQIISFFLFFLQLKGKVLVGK